MPEACPERGCQFPKGHEREHPHGKRAEAASTYAFTAEEKLQHIRDYCDDQIQTRCRDTSPLQRGMVLAFAQVRDHARTMQEQLVRQRHPNV